MIRRGFHIVTLLSGLLWMATGVLWWFAATNPRNRIDQTWVDHRSSISNNVKGFCFHRDGFKWFDLAEATAPNSSAANVQIARQYLSAFCPPNRK